MPKRTIRPVVCIISLLAFIGVSPVFAMDYIHQHVPNAQKVGEARMSVMVWDVYDAALFAPDGQWNDDQPFALQIVYLRDLKGDKIADRTVQEMRKQGFHDEVKLATWHTQMSEIFPDVRNGDALTGIYMQGGQTVFYYGDQEVGRISDAQFGAKFFSIWLSPSSSAPDVRLGLLGGDTMKGRKNNENFERYGSHGITSIN